MRSSLFSIATMPKLKVSLVLLSGAIAYVSIRVVQAIYCTPPRLPSPDIPLNEEDGRVKGFLKRIIFGHFYVIRHGESLLRLQAWCEQFDYKPFMMRIFLRPHIVLSDPHDIEQVLLTREPRFYKGAGYDLVRAVIGDGLLAVSDKRKHSTHRRLFMSVFRSSNIRGICNEVTRAHALEMLADLLTEIQETTQYPTGIFKQQQQQQRHWMTMNMTERVRSMALAAFGDAAFRASRGESLRVREAFDTVMTFSRMNYFCPYMRSRAQKKAHGVIDEVCEMLLEKNLRRRHEGSNSSDDIIYQHQTRQQDEHPLTQQGVTTKTVMDVLVDELYANLSPADVVNHLATFLFAGHDTISHTLQLLFALVGTHLDVQDRLYSELEVLMPDPACCPPVEQLTQCEYLVAVLHEVLRLFPAAPILYRDAASDTLLPASGVVVPKGMTAVISIFSLHRNKHLYGNTVNLFRPERWLGAEGVALRERLGRCGFIPFSCGKRVCIGREFGELEALITTAVVLRSLKVELEGSFPVTKYNITLTTKAPVLMRVAVRDGVDVDAVRARIAERLQGTALERKDLLQAQDVSITDIKAMEEQGATTGSAGSDVNSSSNTSYATPTGEAFLVAV